LAVYRRDFVSCEIFVMQQRFGEIIKVDLFCEFFLLKIIEKILIGGEVAELKCIFVNFPSFVFIIYRGALVDCCFVFDE
jgi:hypothetical protein